MPEQELPPEREGFIETYHAALQHDKADLPPRTLRVAVVRKPVYGILSECDVHAPELAPSEGLLEEYQTERDALQERGASEDGSTSWAADNTDFRERYLLELEESDSASRTLEALCNIGRAQPVAVVCYEAPEKFCHRHELLDVLRWRVWGTEPVDPLPGMDGFDYLGARGGD